MKKSLSLLIVLISLFLFNSSVLALSVPADGEWHEATLTGEQLKSCSSTDSRIEVKYDSSKSKCYVKNKAKTASNFDAEISFKSTFMGSVHNSTSKVSFYSADSNNSSENIKVASETYKTDGKWHDISGEVSGKVIGCTKESGNIEVVFTNGECRVRSTSSSNETGRVKITTNVASSVLTNTVSVNFTSSSNSEEDKYQKQAEDNWEKTFDKTCNNARVLGAFKIVGMGITIVKIIVPIIIILYGMWDLFNIVTSGKDDAIKENAIKFLRRIIIGVLIFFVPTILLNLFDFVGSAWSDVKQEYDNCVKCMLDTSKCPNIDLTKTEG